MFTTTQVFGYLAMSLLVISFLPKQLTLIRTINMVACLFFVVYGFLLGPAWPIIISNGFIAIIQAYHLFVMKKNIVAKN